MPAKKRKMKFERRMGTKIKGQLIILSKLLICFYF